MLGELPLFLVPDPRQPDEFSRIRETGRQGSSGLRAGLLDEAGVAGPARLGIRSSCPNPSRGEVAERLKAAVLKAADNRHWYGLTG